MRYALVVGVLLISVLPAVPKAVAQQPATPPDSGTYFRAYPLRHVDAATAKEQLGAMLSVIPGAEIVADVRTNRVLVSGGENVHQLTQQLLERIDVAGSVPTRPPTNAGPAVPQLEAYALSPATRQEIASWQQEFAHHNDVRIALDERTSQALVLAPPRVHEVLKQRLNFASRATAAGAFRPQTVNPNSQPPPRTAWPEGAGPQTITIQLRHIDGVGIHGRLERLLEKPLPTTSDASGQWLQFTLVGAAADAVRVSVQQQSGIVKLSGLAGRVAQWRRVIEALDQNLGTDGSVTQIVTTQPDSHDQVRRALELIQQGQFGRRHYGDGPAAQLVATALQAPANQDAGASTPTEAPPSEETAEGSSRQAAQILAGLPEDVAGGLLGPVDIEFVEGLDIILIHGSERDVQRVLAIINQIEQLSAVTVPRIQVYQLKNVNSESLAELMAGLYAQTGVLGTRVGSVSITPLAKPNALLLIGRPNTVQMATELAAKLDQPVDPFTHFEVFPLKHASAADAETVVEEFLERQEEEDQEERPPTLAPQARVVADTRTNSLIVSASPGDLAEIRALVAKLDAESGAAVDQVRVIHLKNTVASELAEVLQGAIQAQTAGGEEAEPGTGAGGRVSALEFLTIDAGQTRPVKSGILTNVRISADARANALVVRAPAESMELIVALIKQLDRAPDVEAVVKVFEMTNGDAVSLRDMLQTLFGTTEGQQATGGFGENPLVRMQFSVDERTNSIIAVGSTEDLEVVEAILRRLDSGEVRERITTVYRLKNASAQNVSDALNLWLQTYRQAQQQAELAVSPFEQIEREVIIVPEIGSNSLIVSATPRYYDDVRTLIEDLDDRPPLVVIQVLIAEVALNDTDEFGVELGLQDSLLFDRSTIDIDNFQTTTTSTQTTSGGGADISTVTEENIVNSPLVPGFNFNGADLGNNGSSTALANAANVAAQGLSNFAMGRVNSELGFGGFVFSASSSSVSALLRALQETRRLEVLSRPQIVALDGQEGYVLVGQQVPTIETSVINVGVQTNTVSYQDVGLGLRVTPRVSPDDLVVMQVTAVKSRLAPLDEGIPISISPGGDVVRSPIIETTQAVTTVSALDGQTIVLSGLLTKETSDIHRRVPIIADIPLLGDLFRFDSVAEERKELLIILTPRVMKNDLEVELLKQVESSRMSWVLGDVIDIHGEAGLRSRCDEWGDGETESVYPSVIPSDAESLPTPALHEDEDADDTDNLELELEPLDDESLPLPFRESKRGWLPTFSSFRKKAQDQQHDEGIQPAQFDSKLPRFSDRQTGQDSEPTRLPPL